MEEGGNGKEVLAKKKKGKARRSRRWKGTERDSRGAGSSKEKKKMEEEGDQRERKKTCMLEPEQRNERILKEADLWRKRGNHRKSRAVK